MQLHDSDKKKFVHSRKILTLFKIVLEECPNTPLIKPNLTDQGVKGEKLFHIHHIATTAL